MSRYQEILDYLYSQLPMYQRVGPAAHKPDLSNTIAICNLLKNPHNNFKSIHVAGTNGKGSVSHFTASVLQETGLKVGLYTSPHLKDFRERIRINGEMISEKYVIDFAEQYKNDFEEIKPSFFEMTVGMAFKYFSDEKVDIAVLETGLGGRLDSTNVIDPLLSIITNIGYDHMQFLGDTLVEIAAEKAGIIKSGRPVVIGETQVEVREVFIAKASETGSDIFFSDEFFKCERQKAKGRSQKSEGRRQKGSFCENQRVICENLREISKEPRRGVTFRCPLLGDYQTKNIQTTICAIHVLNEIGYKIETDNLINGIENIVTNTGIQGRWEILSEEPLTICDIGHNKDGIAVVVDQIKNTPHKNLHFVFGVVEDKNLSEILEILPFDAIYYFCKANIPRGMDAGKLAVAAAAAGFKGKAYSSVSDAFYAAKLNADPNDMVFVGGSTFVVAEVV
jgi:dihydrofolate synthase/folylpolyglutamate synthase